MASKTKPKKPNRAPAYSADSMALHLALGIVLIVLGVMIFLAVVVNMPGDVFAGLRQVCFGLTGGLAFLMPVLPVWGGVLVLLSAYRKAPLRGFMLAAALYMLVLAAANLVATYGSPAVPLMTHFYSLNLQKGHTPGAFDAFLARAYEMGANRHVSGGLLGMVPAWPLWQLFGSPVPGAILCILGAVALFLCLIRLDVKGLAAKAKALSGKRQEKQQQEQHKLRQQELMWQQQMQMQPVQQQQQQYYQQPVQQQYYQQAPQPRPAEQPTSYQPTEEIQRPVRERRSFPFIHRDEPAPEGSKNRLSRIFARKEAEEAQPSDAPKPARKSYIFAPVEEETPAPVMPEEAPAYAPPVKPPRKKVPAFTEEEPAQTGRKASWRSEEETEYQPKPRKKAQPKAQPQPSWEETPPWEEGVADVPATSPAPVKPPKLQQEPPKDAWRPELKLPPRKNGPQGEQVEMDLPPPYVYPGLNLLDAPSPQSAFSPEEDAMRSQRLEETLQSFKVPAKVRHITHGPAISRFELELAPGIKVTKVTDLSKNIAMNMEVKSVRIEAPIPGKALVGVEVPNRKVSKVMLREVLESEPMAKAKSPLTVALGKDIAGTPIVCDLARMPHLLIAGATGSGKSVCINTMINSLLYRCSPQEVRLILIDPKVVELQCYNGIPHLLIPVVSDPHKASGALAWAVAEMMDRYKKFEMKGVRAIDGYNSHLEDGEESMPRIVIIIDELADLMMTCKRDVEDHICRLAQLARAAGIHLVVATQRPSVDVITGLIKANIPSRIAFKVSSFIDSRTILDRQGAEQLLGWGDMLYLPTGEFTPIRIQGCFMDDSEVNRVTDFIKESCPADYDPNVLEQLDKLTHKDDAPSADLVESSEPTNSDDSLLAQCIEMAVTDGQVSTSLLQRRLKVGYARAGRLVDEMERRGIVGAKDGAKPRPCLISREEFELMKLSGDLDE